MVTFELPNALMPFARGLGEVRVEDARGTVREALVKLGATHPGIVERVLTEQGEVREHVNLFVGEENIRFLGGLSTPVAEGETITIVPAVSGG
ncbi:MAG TPA: MoaD/ThiS family protein [Gemmatimonadaceae bacterium]|nr:MoaD/ThiS family protein [Gemmatimonadaceae bacterium]